MVKQKPCKDSALHFILMVSVTVAMMKGVGGPLTDALVTLKIVRVVIRGPKRKVQNSFATTLLTHKR